LATYGHVANSSDIGPARIIITYPIGDSPRAGVRQKYFTHKTHTIDYEVPCAYCHHVFEDGKNVWQQGMPVQKCSECHDAAWKGEEDIIPGVQLKIMILTPECARCHAKGEGD
jgi:hypothetical protein